MTSSTPDLWRPSRRQLLRSGLALGGLVAAPGLLAACGNSGSQGEAASAAASNGAGGEGQAFTFWQYKYNPGTAGATYLEEAATRFAEQTGHTPTVEFKSAEGIEQAVAAAANAGEGFDALMWWSGPTVRNQASLGNVIALDDLLPADRFDNMLGAEAQQYDDSFYGVSHTVGPYFLFYNRTILEQAGLDPASTFPSASEASIGWEEFLEILERIKTDVGIAPLMWANKEGYFNEWWFYNLEAQSFDSVEEYAEINFGDASWQDERIYDAMAAWKQLYDGGYFFDGGEVIAYEQHPRQVASQEAAMSPYYTFDLAVAELKKVVGEENVGFARVPSYRNDTELHDATNMEPNSLYVASFADQRDVAVEWITFLSSVEEMNTFAKATQESMGDARWDSSVIADERIREVYEGTSRKSCVYPYTYATQAQYEELLSSGILFLNGQLSAEELAAQFDQVDKDYKASTS